MNEDFLQDWHHLTERGSLWQQVQKLKAELKAAQKLSLERHHRLRAQSAKTKTAKPS